MREKPIKTGRTGGWMAKISLILVFTLAILLHQGWLMPGEAQAALEYVGGASGSGTAATYNVSLTGLTGGSGSAAAAGDLVIVVTGWASAADGNPGVTTVGYTEVADLWGNDTRDANLSVSWKIMGATPDTLVTVSGFNNAANGGATVVHVWRGADQTTPMDVAVTTATAINAARPDSPAITPVTTGAYVLAAGLGTDDTTPLTQTAPTGYGNALSVAGTGTTMSVVANIASKAWAGGAEDPAAWTGGESTTSDSWAAATIAIRPAPVVPGAGLLHNSDSTGSAKWAPNGWGVAGGKYGEFVCETCHVKSTTDIKRIKTTITTPDGSNFQGRATNSVSVNFQSATTPNGFGDDATNSPRASSTKICEVCHTYDNTQANGVNAHPYSVGVALPNHKAADNTDCTTCHQHSKGFKASCDTCHGYPPTVSTPGVPDGLADNNGATPGGTTGSTVSGAHGAHVTTGNIACTACHYGSVGQGVTHNNGDLKVTLGFYPFSTAQGGAYNGQTTVVYEATVTSPVTSTSSGGAKTCSTVYCHGGFTGGLSATPAWDGTSGCGTCHGRDAATPPSNANHPRHAGQAAGQLGLVCTTCHPSRTVSWDGHVDASVQWDLDRTDARLGSAASYRATELGSTGAKAPSATYGTCTSVYCHSTVQNNGATAAGTYNTITWGGAALTCTAVCHTENPSTGSHDLHVTTQAYLCSACHNGAGDETALHANNVIDMSIQNAGTYSQGSAAPAPANTGYGSCSTSWCHGTNSGTWGANTTNATCTKCHGAPTAVASYTLYKAAPGADGTGVDTAGQTGNTDAQVGAHDAHVRSLMNISVDIPCTECHIVPTNVGDLNHIDSALPVEITFGTLAKTGGLTPGTNLPTSPTTCTNTYCHAKATFAGTDTSPTWNNSAYLPATMTTAGCGMCHAYPPAGHAAGDCSGCHTHVATGANPVSFVDVTKHINGVVEGGDCISCHTIAQDNADGVPTRRAMSAEFTTFTHGHAKTAGSWTKFQCGVCHMEGDPATGSTTALHKNNTLDFRDPDSGVTIKGVTFAGTPGSYSSTATDATASVFARNTGGNVLETFAQAVMVNMCLKCHDGGATAGANSAAARVTGGTATQPFGTTAGTVINVNDDFATTNATYHPVRGKQNNWYADTDTMNAPWNPAARTAPANNTTYGYLITCWDCHDSSAAGRTIGGTTAPSVLHGNAATVRAPYDAVDNSATQICVICHKSSVYWTNSIHNIGAVTGDSALDSTSDNATWATWHGFTKSGYYVGCTVCHGTTPYGGALPAAGSRSKDVHGANTTAAGGTTWPTSATPPYSFLRMTNNLGVWDNSPGTCTNMCGTRDYTYTSGGTY